MKTLLFTIYINATPNKVWASLWQPENYTEWTSHFTKGSYYKTDSFSEGSRIQLLTPAGDGMFSILDKVDPPRFLAFRHLGMVMNFEEQPMDETTEAWTNAIESYLLEPVDEGVNLIVSVDTAEEYEPYMNEKFPVALAALKQIAEA
jgi:uncharacterized protein YndB with AHSA1/START domain